MTLYGILARASIEIQLQKNWRDVTIFTARSTLASFRKSVHIDHVFSHYINSSLF